MDEIIAAVILASILVVFGFVLGIAGFFRAGAAMREVRDLRRLLNQQIALRSTATDAPSAEEPQPYAPPSQRLPPQTPVPQDAAAPQRPPPDRPAVPPTPAATLPRVSTPRHDFENLLTMRWSVWLGAVALLLAGVFLVRYASEQGLLGPATRCTAAALLGFALLGGAVRLKRADLPPTEGRFAVDQAPAALAAGGVAVLFGAAYGAGPYYNLLPSLLAFAGMALASFVGLGAALYFGSLTAAVGIVGAFVTPALIESHDPSLVGLFAYLTVATIGAQAVVRRTAWTWLGWAATIAAALWVVVAATMPPRPDSWAAAAFVPAVAFIGLRLPSAALDLTIGRVLAWGQFATIAFAGLVLQAAAPSGAARLALFALAPIAIGKAMAAPALDRLPWLAAACGLSTLYLWDGGEHAYGFDFAGARDPKALLFTAWVSAVAHAVVGLLLERRAPNPSRWSALVAAVPVLTLALCYAVVGRLEADVRWGLVGLLLALFLTATTYGAMRRAQETQAGIHAAGAVATLALAFGMALHDHWLTVALALTLPALAWIEGKVGPRALRTVAGVAAYATMAILAYWLLRSIDKGRPWLAGQPFVTYGVPALAFFAASRLFRRGGDDWVVVTLEAGAAATASLFIAIEIRVLFGHPRLDSPFGFDEVTTFMLSAAAQAVAYDLAARRTARVVAEVARWLLGGIAALLAICLLLANPLITNDRLGTLSLVMAYLVPALLAGAFGVFAASAPLRRALHFYAVVAGFTWVTIQVRHLFHPEAMGLFHSPVVEAEMWTWSGAWLVFGVVVLVLGVQLGSRLLRLAALTLFGLITLKVFVVDMSALTGLWRVASFLGLGLALIGLGSVYRHFVLPRQASA